MKCAVDLHMHSCLSPCGDMDMTPNNMANMAKIKGLDMIACADHNTARQLPAIKRVADEIGLALLPAIELNTREEVHMLAYFRTVEEALDFSDFIYDHLPPIKNKPSVFGQQAIMNEDDEITGEIDKLLINALDLSIDDLAEELQKRGALAVPAHINRGSTGILNVLGFIPPTTPFSAMEVKVGFPLPHKGMPNLKHLHSSDAHYLEDIFEADEFLDLPECSPDGFFEYILSK